MTTFVLQMHSSAAVVPLCVIEASDFDSALETIDACSGGTENAWALVSFRSKKAEDDLLVRVKATRPYVVHYTLTEVPWLYAAPRPQNTKIDPFSAGC